MMNISSELVDHEWYGESSQSTIQRLRFHICDFQKREEKVQESPENYFSTGAIKAHGNVWCLAVVSQGYDDQVEIRFVITEGDDEVQTDENLVFYVGGNNQFFNKRIFDRQKLVTSSNGYFEMPRDEVLQKMNEHGALIVDVDIEIANNKEATEDINQSSKTTITDDVRLGIDLYHSLEETFDISFLIEHPILHNERRVVQAHKCILAIRARVLYDMVSIVKEEPNNNNNNDDDNHNSNMVVLSDVDPALLEIVLKFVYTGEYDEGNNSNSNKKMKDDMKNETKSLLMLADRLGCTQFKIHLEAILLNTYLDEFTAAELFVFADCHSCALLKEGAMDEYVMNPSGVMKGNTDEAGMEEKEEEGTSSSSSSTPPPTLNYWSQIVESSKLLAELLQYTSIDHRKQQYVPFEPMIQSTTTATATSISTRCICERMDVTSIRDRLRVVNLSIDGSREVLTNRWVEYRTTTTATTTKMRE